MRLIRRMTLTGLAVVVSSITTGLSAADSYEPDNTWGTNLALLIHGQSESHDLDGTGDVDYVQVEAAPGHSYEVRVIAQGFFPLTLTRRGPSDILLQTGTGYAFNSTRDAAGGLSNWNGHWSSFVSWIEPTDPANRTRYVRVDAQGFIHTASASQYTIELRETTVYCPRYNNLASQTTVLIMQNAAPQEAYTSCSWVANFYNQTNTGGGYPLVGSLASATALLRNGMMVVPTTSVPGVNATGGSIQIAHTCGFGNLQAKAVALEPTTGFTFDTTCQPRPSR